MAVDRIEPEPTNRARSASNEPRRSTGSRPFLDALLGENLLAIARVR